MTGNPPAVVSGLVKMQTGLAQVDAASYVRQAEEVFAKSKARTEELSHPDFLANQSNHFVYLRGDARARP